MNENENNVLKNIQICIFLKESDFASLLLKFLFLFFNGNNKLYFWELFDFRLFDGDMLNFSYIINFDFE